MHIKTSDQQELSLGFGSYTCNWGLHIAGLYETEAERDEIIFGFQRQGHQEGDLQLYCPAERTRSAYIRHFSEFCPDCAKDLDNEDVFVIKDPKELYYPNGAFSPWQMDRALEAFYERSREGGRRNVRAAAEMVWALDAIPGIEHLMVYESRLNYFIPGKPWISICMYNVRKFDGATLMNVLRTHPFTISKGIITQNPYYQDPGQWLAENAPRFCQTN
ncbi:MAG TPA: MEDS domain-containing protein [Bacteroidales bacterium]|nr:MEDS domain-containing protein [Bacteroidales bacterium]